MKKVLSLILALTLAFAMAVPALAENTTGGNVTISTSVDETYTVTIPATGQTIVWGALSTDIGAVTLTAARIEPGAAVRVATSPSGTLKNSLDATKTIAYTLKSGDSAFTTKDFVAANETAQLSIAIEQSAWNAALAGSYTDTITFTVSYIEPTPKP